MNNASFHFNNEIVTPLSIDVTMCLLHMPGRLSFSPRELDNAVIGMAKRLMRDVYDALRALRIFSRNILCRAQSRSPLSTCCVLLLLAGGCRGKKGGDISPSAASSSGQWSQLEWISAAAEPTGAEDGRRSTGKTQEQGLTVGPLRVNRGPSNYRQLRN